MIGIDTNILIRYIVQDVPKQARLATNFLESNCSKEQPGYINTIVLCEVVWVLQSAYQYKKDIIVQVIQALIATAELKIENHDLARKALDAYEQGPADFSDYFLGYINQSNGAEYTASFDKKACKSPLFKKL